MSDRRPAPAGPRGWYGVATSANGTTVMVVESGKAIEVSYTAGASWGAVSSTTAAPLEMRIRLVIGLSPQNWNGTKTRSAAQTGPPWRFRLRVPRSWW